MVFGTLRCDFAITAMSPYQHSVSRRVLLDWQNSLVTCATLNLFVYAQPATGVCEPVCRLQTPSSGVYTIHP